MSEILINTTTTGLQHQPAVAPLGDTRYFVVWVDSSDLNIFELVKNSTFE